MFLIDDILCSPFSSLLYIFRELHQAVQQDAVTEAEAIRTALSELYMLLETAQISEAEADALEKELLDRLEELETRGRNKEEDDVQEDMEEETEEIEEAEETAESEEPDAEA
jgi:gas vesicle protein GvpG